MDELGRVQLRHEEGVPVIMLAGEFDMSNVDDFRNCVRTLLGGGRRRVVLDLTDTTFIDSAAISVIASAYRDGIDLTIRHVCGEPRRALELTGVLELFPTED